MWLVVAVMRSLSVWLVVAVMRSLSVCVAGCSCDAQSVCVAGCSCDAESVCATRRVCSTCGFNHLTTHSEADACQQGEPSVRHNCNAYACMQCICMSLHITGCQEMHGVAVSTVDQWQEHNNVFRMRCSLQ